jgi:hypothetical protein
VPDPYDSAEDDQPPEYSLTLRLQLHKVQHDLDAYTSVLNKYENAEKHRNLQQHEIRKALAESDTSWKKAVDEAVARQQQFVKQNNLQIDEKLQRIMPTFVKRRTPEAPHLATIHLPDLEHTVRLHTPTDGNCGIHTCLVVALLLFKEGSLEFENIATLCRLPPHQRVTLKQTMTLYVESGYRQKPLRHCPVFMEMTRHLRLALGRAHTLLGNNQRGIYIGCEKRWLCNDDFFPLSFLLNVCTLLYGRAEPSDPEPCIVYAHGDPTCQFVRCFNTCANERKVGGLYPPYGVDHFVPVLEIN